MKVFATMALFGALACGKSDHMYKILSYGKVDEHSLVNDNSKYLVSLMGLDESAIGPDATNALSDMAYALMDENFHYTAADNEKIPTYHVIHSDDDI